MILFIAGLMAYKLGYEALVGAITYASLPAMYLDSKADDNTAELSPFNATPAILATANSVPFTD